MGGKGTIAVGAAVVGRGRTRELLGVVGESITEMNQRAFEVTKLGRIEHHGREVIGLRGKRATSAGGAGARGAGEEATVCLDGFRKRAR